MLSLARSTVVDEIPMPMAGQFTTATALQPAAPKPQPRVRYAKDEIVWRNERVRAYVYKRHPVV